MVDICDVEYNSVNKYNTDDVDSSNWPNYYNKVVNELVLDTQRNKLLVTLINSEVELKHRVLCITSRLDHIKTLKTMCCASSKTYLLSAHCSSNIGSSRDIEQCTIMFTSYYTFKQQCSLLTSFNTIILLTPDMIPHDVIDKVGNLTTNSKLTKVISILDTNQQPLMQRRRQKDNRYRANKITTEEQHINQQTDQPVNQPVNQHQLVNQCLICCDSQNGVNMVSDSGKRIFHASSYADINPLFTPDHDYSHGLIKKCIASTSSHN